MQFKGSGMLVLHLMNTLGKDITLFKNQIRIPYLDDIQNLIPMHYVIRRYPIDGA